MTKKRVLRDEEKVKQLEGLCQIQCTYAEIAAVMGVELTTVERWAQNPHWRAIMDRGKRSGFVSLRRAQFQLALAGNATMQIWLGKQLLGQRDILTHEGTVDYNVSGAARAAIASKLAGLIGPDEEQSTADTGIVQ